MTDECQHESLNYNGQNMLRCEGCGKDPEDIISNLRAENDRWYSAWEKLMAQCRKAEAELATERQARERAEMALETIEGALQLAPPSLLNQSLSNIARGVLQREGGETEAHCKHYRSDQPWKCQPTTGHPVAFDAADGSECRECSRHMHAHTYRANVSEPESEEQHG